MERIEICNSRYIRVGIQSASNLSVSRSMLLLAIRSFVSQSVRQTFTSYVCRRPFRDANFIAQMKSELPSVRASVMPSALSLSLSLSPPSMRRSIKSVSESVSGRLSKRDLSGLLKLEAGQQKCEMQSGHANERANGKLSRS